MSRTLFQNSQIAFLKMSALQRVLWARSLSPLVRRGDIRGGRRLVPAQLVISRRFRQIGLFLEMICQGLGQKLVFDPALVVPDGTKPLEDGAIL
ncbi:MAG TPA: hypothetical protein PKV71_11295, partial [Calditrichia bacterium]|nr:hypothetical protein [Calditrichia bacterium]